MSITHQKRELSEYWLSAQAAVGAYVTGMVLNFNDAEDVLQSVAAAVIAKFDTYDPSQPFVAWALGIARYEVLQYFRKLGSDPHIFSSEAQESIARAYEELEPQIDRYRIALSRCIGKLSSRARNVLEWRYLHDVKTGRIAARLGTTPAAVSAMLFRIRKSLRECIEKQLAAGGGA